MWWKWSHVVESWAQHANIVAYNGSVDMLHFIKIAIYHRGTVTEDILLRDNCIVFFSHFWVALPSHAVSRLAGLSYSKISKLKLCAFCDEIWRHVDAGSASDGVPQFSGVRSVLLGSSAVRHQKIVVGVSSDHGNYGGWISRGYRQYLSRKCM